MSGACGTYGGYHKHLYRGVAPCDRCREAKRVYESEKRAERRADLASLPHPSNTAWDAGCRCEPCKAAHDIRHIEKYGISADEYAALLETQGDGCAICGASSYGTQGLRLHIDHDHACCKTGCRECVRGILCAGCNCWQERKQTDKWLAYIGRARPFARDRAS